MKKLSEVKSFDDDRIAKAQAALKRFLRAEKEADTAAYDWFVYDNEGRVGDGKPFSATPEDGEKIVRRYGKALAEKSAAAFEVKSVLGL